MSERRQAVTLCPLCEASCGLELTVAGTTVELVRGNRRDTFSRGHLCPKATALRDLHHDPDRLVRPRVRRKGRLVEVDFDEAYAEVDTLLSPLIAEYGRSSLALVIGNPAVHRTGLVLYALELAAAMGSPNVFSAATLDQMPRHLACGLMYGDFYSVPVPDIDRCDALVLIGANPMVSNGSMWSVPDFANRARALQARGGSITVIDPRRTETATAADHHLAIRPGADAVLLAAVVQVMFSEDLVHLDRNVAHVRGLDQLAAAVEHVSPELAALACGLHPDEIRSLARRIATAPCAAVYGRIGTCHQRHATVANWLIDVVNVLTGNLDRPGGVMFPTPAAFGPTPAGTSGVGPGVAVGRYHSRVSGAPEVMGQFPLACLPEEILTPGPGQVRGLVTMASNLARSAPESTTVERALRQLEVLVCLDVYVNETTRFADVILPGPSPLEEVHYDVFFSPYGHRNAARAAAPVFDIPAGMRHDWETMVTLIAIVSGRGAGVPPEQMAAELFEAAVRAQAPDFADGIIAASAERSGAERLLDLGLRTGPFGDLFGMAPEGLSLDRVLGQPDGIDLGALVPRLPDALRTPSGMIELFPAELAVALDRALVDLTQLPAETVLIGRRHLRSNNSWMHNLPVLAKGRDRCVLLVHPDDAVRWGLVAPGGSPIAGGRAVVANPITGAQVEVPFTTDDGLRPGVVSLPHGWGHDGDDVELSVAANRPGVNVNVLTVAAWRDELSGNAALSGIPVRVGPAPGAGAVLGSGPARRSTP